MPFYSIVPGALIVQAATLSDFPATGVENAIYIAQDTNTLYRWTGSEYVVVSAASIPVATDSVLGGVLDGDGVTIAVDGTISSDLLATGITSIVAISQADYDLLSPPDATTLYVIT